MPGMDELNSLVTRLESVALRLEGAAGGSAAGAEAANSSSSATVAEFDTVLAGAFAKFIKISQDIGGEVGKIGIMAQQAFTAERKFIATASISKKPSDKELMLLLSPISNKISEITEYREKNRRSEYFNHLSAISESIAALGWVSVSPAPAPFVKEMNDAGQFYLNRVLKDWKAKSEKHVEWTKTWSQTLNELQAYVKAHHTTGLTWNPKGGEASAGAPPPPPPGAPLPPPPPPPGALDMTSGDSGSNTRGDLLSALNKGADITKGLKKVSADQMTHKNPNLRSSSVVPHKEKPALPPKYGGAVTAKNTMSSKPPKLELDGKKWLVEYQKGNKNIEIKETENNHSVYIYKCEASNIVVKGKVNNIIMDSCKKTAVVFDTVVSGLEFINCQSVQMQVLGSVASISIDKTDGCQVYLSKDSLKAEIISAKSSEMNVLFPKGEDFVEHAVPEQFKTVIKGGKLVTSSSESI